MSFEEFQHLARLYIIGKLDPDEMDQFQAGRQAFGVKAEEFINECRKLSIVLALSLCPCKPDPMTKEKLFAKIRKTGPPDDKPRGSGSRTGSLSAPAILA